jgi:hypothetical protein
MYLLDTNTEQVLGHYLTGVAAIIDPAILLSSWTRELDLAM